MKLATLGAALALGITLAVPVSAQSFDLAAATRSVVTQEDPIPLRARVTDVDLSTGTMTVQGALGAVAQLPVVMRPDGVTPPGVGDAIDVQYKNALAVDVFRAAPKNGIRTRVDTNVLVPERSGYEMARQVEVEAVVQHVDAKHRELTLRGVHEPVTVSVGRDVDLKHLKPGDTVHAIFVSAFSVRDVQS